ncbi:MAG: hypothetical protein M3512_14670 [Bacteroidota bacterium]|nr:hypothetical protein [Bacteroidota bacterium]MDQ3534930.1 hypothetical protein [Bacteroidota bacterium]
MLNDDQLDYIHPKISKSKIDLPLLKEDLLDHFCCVTEHHMKNGMNFHETFDFALQEVAPTGILEIQNETIFY